LRTHLERAGVAHDAIVGFEEPGAAYRAAREMASETDRIIVFGSFLTVAAALAEEQRGGSA
jgi:folylpolyglutamate synthase/dihydropteroate synthase